MNIKVSVFTISEKSSNTIHTFLSNGRVAFFQSEKKLFSWLNSLEIVTFLSTTLSPQTEKIENVDKYSC